MKPNATQRLRFLICELFSVNEKETTLKRPHGISKPLRWGRVLLAMSLISAASVHDAGAQTYYNLSSGNYSEDFSQISTWTSPTTNSWSGVAIGGTATIPAAVKITANTTIFMGTNGTGTSSSSGVQRPTTNLQLLGAGGTDNSTSVAMDLNLDFTSRTSGTLAFNAAAVVNSTGNRTGTLRVYYSTDATNWAEITGGNLPYVAKNNVVSSAAVNVSIPTAVDGKNQVKLRFYYHNGGTGSVTGTPAGSRPKISIDDVSVTSVASVVADTTPPAISSLVPSNGAVNVSANAALQLGFSESVVAGTGTIKIFKSDGTEAQSFQVSDSNVSISGSVATITLKSNLISGGSYYGQVSAGAFKDAAGNSFAEISNTTTWAFTVDSTAPVVSTFSPANGATGIAPPSAVSLTFSESINIVSGKYITIRKSNGTLIETHDASPFDNVIASGSVVTVTLANPSLLDYGVTYNVEVEAGAVEDNSGNSFAGISGSSTFSFTTASVPELGTGAGYSQTFSSFTSIETIPLGWSLSGAVKTYMGDWGTGFNAGVVGNASVFGYQHTSSTGTFSQILTLRNTSGAPITDLVISYKGRVARADQTRIPIYTVNVAGTAVSALAYSTADGDNLSRSATLTGLSIAAGATFQVQWISDRGLSSGSSRQIGISDVSVAVGVKQSAPTVTESLSLANLTHVAGVFNGSIGSDGGSTITERGFVYALTATSTTPIIGASGVTKVVDAATGTEPFTASISDLTAATSYTMRAYAINGVGTSYGTAISFTTLATPPTFTSSYSQAFAAYNGTNPAGWSAISSAGSQSYAGAWGNLGGSAGFIGGDSNPGVLGYQHTSGTGTLTTTLTLTNGSGGTLDQLYISYLGRAARTADSTAARSPEFAVSVNGVVVSALAYSTANNVDATLATTLTGLNIAPGAAFTISWASDRGTGSGTSKQIGLSSVLVASSEPPPLDPGDTDGDGLADAWEMNYFGNLSESPAADGDLDGLSNQEEKSIGTNPTAADTDADGMNDGQEIALGRNPLKIETVFTLGSLSHQFNGAAKSASATIMPSGLSVNFTYNGSPTAPSAVGSYVVVGTINDANYTGSAIGTLVISKGVATVTLGGLTTTYDGTPKSASATTTPNGLGVNFTYNGSSTQPADAGSYAVVASVSDTNYLGEISGTLVIAKGEATVTLGSLMQIDDGTAKSATAITSPAGLMVDFSYNGTSTAPTATGNYMVTGTIRDLNYQGSASGTLALVSSPTISVQPTSVRANQGETVTFNVVTAGNNLSYQWQKNGADIPEAVMASLTIAQVQLADEGSYTVKISNLAGNITSQSATLAALFGPGDLDGDGLTNNEESTIYHTNPNLADTDHDGLTDGYEVGIGRFSVVLGSCIWEQARLSAIARGGNLASFTSQVEWDIALKSLGDEALLDVNGLWIGANDAAVEGQWAWTTGESFSFSLWATGQPDNLNNSDYAAVSGDLGGETGKWYDFRGVTLRDGYILEIGYKTDPTVADADGDGLSDAQEQAVSSNPFVADTDGDGLSDGQEANLTHTSPTNADSNANGINDAQDDADADGLSNLVEVGTKHTDPLLADTDGDGLSDGAEALTHHTNPLVADTDGDSYSDGYEVLNSSNPAFAESFPTYSLTLVDGGVVTGGRFSKVGTWAHGSTATLTAVADAGYVFSAWTGNLTGSASPQSLLMDGNKSVGAIFDHDTGDGDSDGLTNYEEAVTYGTRPDLADSDGDGLSDFTEIQTHHTNPILADSNGDGLADGVGIQMGLDPLLDHSALVKIIHDSRETFGLYKPQDLTDVRPSSTTVRVLPGAGGLQLRLNVQKSTDLFEWQDAGEAVYKQATDPSAPKQFFRFGVK